MQFQSVIRFICLVNAVKCASGIPLGTTENTKFINGDPLETQHAVCKVFTKEIEATAKATITRQLKGVCSSRDLDAKFDALQQELRQIKQALSVNDRYGYKSLQFTRTTSTIRPDRTSASYTEPNFVIDPEPLRYDSHYGAKEEDSFEAKLKEEITQLNDTIVESSEGDLYFYYWRIQEIRNVLRRTDIYVSSPAFSVLGHTLHLQFYPNYMSEYIGVLLKPDSNSFLKKHKILFLGQTITQNEISSKILYGMKNDEKIFKIRTEMLTGDFLSDNNLLVKVKIYLNS